MDSSWESGAKGLADTIISLVICYALPEAICSQLVAFFRLPD